MDSQQEQQSRLVEILLSLLWAALESHKRSSFITANDCPAEFLFPKYNDVDYQSMVVIGFSSIFSLCSQ
jgi:hypothetical protein